MLCEICKNPAVINRKGKTEKTNRYSKTCGKKTCKSKLRKRSSHNCIEYWVHRKGLSLEEAQEKRKEVIKNMHRKNSFYWKNGKESLFHSRTTNINYWLKKGYSYDEAQEKLSERQRTFTLEKCIEKLGKEAGKKRWLERQEKWQKTMNDKSDDEKAEINKKRTGKRTPFSKISQELFWSILFNLKEKNNIYFATINNGLADFSGLNHEYVLVNRDKLYFIDFYDRNRNKIIEFNGYYWHNKLTEQDLLREKNMKNILNCDILIIKEKEYKNNKEDIIKQCMDFLGN